MLLGYILCITHLYVWTDMVLACPMSHTTILLLLI